MCLVELRLWEKVETLRTTITAANQHHRERRHLFVECDDDGVSGWGEVTPVDVAVGGDPSWHDVRHALETHALPSVVDIARREGVLPEWSRLHLLAGANPASRWAYAAIEMALLDRTLVTSSESVESLWGVRVNSVPTIATCSLLDFDVSWRPPSNASRVRVKTAPGVTLSSRIPVLASWNLPILLDFNASADSFATVRDQVDELRSSLDVVAVEQPFPPGDLASHAILARELDVAISLDEGVRTLLDVRLIARHRAASVVCVKPSRVGGVAAARATLAEAASHGLRSYVGGFFESPVARRANAAVAAGFAVEPSDVAAVDFGDEARHDYDTRAHGIGVWPRKETLTPLSAYLID